MHTGIRSLSLEWTAIISGDLLNGSVDLERSADNGANWSYVTSITVTDGVGSVFSSDLNDFIPDPVQSYQYRLNALVDSTPQASANTIFVSVTNAQPVANGQAASTAEDTPKALTLTGSDANPDDDDSLTYVLPTVNQTGYPAHGTLSGTGGANITYTPATDYFGTDSFTFHVTDDHGLASEATVVTLTITAANDAPVIAQGAGTVIVLSEDETPTAFVAPTLTAADADDATNTLTWSKSAGPSHGTATVSGTGASPTISYTPDDNYFGADSFHRAGERSAQRHRYLCHHALHPTGG